MKKKSDDILDAEYSPQAAKQSAQRTAKLDQRAKHTHSAPASEQSIGELARAWGAKVKRK